VKRFELLLRKKLSSEKNFLLESLPDIEADDVQPENVDENGKVERETSHFAFQIKFKWKHIEDIETGL
jgi:hypothetical protein